MINIKNRASIHQTVNAIKHNGIADNHIHKTGTKEQINTTIAIVSRYGKPQYASHIR